MTFPYSTKIGHKIDLDSIGPDTIWLYKLASIYINSLWYLYMPYSGLQSLASAWVWRQNGFSPTWSRSHLIGLGPSIDDDVCTYIFFIFQHQHILCNQYLIPMSTKEDLYGYIQTYQGQEIMISFFLATQFSMEVYINKFHTYRICTIFNIIWSTYERHTFPLSDQNLFISCPFWFCPLAACLTNILKNTLNSCPSNKLSASTEATNTSSSFLLF